MAKSTGIMILFEFSMPRATPNPMIRKVTAIATTIHRLFPNREAVALNRPPMLSMSSPIRYSCPVTDRNTYLKIQPTTQV